MAKVIFSFDDKSAKKLKNKKYILGGKGANLGEMGRLGLPVPPGFTISTNVCDIFYKNKKKLPNKIIKNKELIKEMEYASTLTDPEGLKKIISTALSGTYTAWRRVWRTGVVLPFNLIVAVFVTGEKLSSIMTDWEDTDKIIKAQQMNIINQTGVAKTVDAMLAVCNPGAYAFQKFVEWENKDLKNTWKKGGRQFWDNTFGAFNKNLKIENDDKDLEENATILYANFVVYCCSILNLSINQKAMSSKPVNTKLSSAVSPSNKVSRDSREYKSLLKWFASENFYQLEEVNKQKVGDLNKIKTLKDLFTNISKNTVSVKRAAELEALRLKEILPIMEKARQQQFQRDLIGSQVQMAGQLLGNIYPR